MMNSSLRPRSGFTLIEVLVYLTIFIMVTTAATYLLISLSDVVDRYRAHTLLYRSGSSALEHITVELRKADQFNAAGSVTNVAETGALSVTNNSTTTTFNKSGSQLVLSKNSVNYGNIVDDAVMVNGFTVYQYTTSIGTLVRIKLNLTATVGNNSKSMTFYGGSVIRGDL